MITYLKYFFFTGLNWDWVIAWRLLKDNLYGEKKYGIHTAGYDKLNSLAEEGIDTSHATLYMPVSYKLLEELFTKINLANYHHFIDIGCGKGRAICTAAHCGVGKITGIDFSAKLCSDAKKNVHQIQHLFTTTQFEIINIDATEYKIPQDADCIFLFNPFDDTIMKKVMGNILHSLQQHSRKITILYVNPMHKELFIATGFKQIHYIKRMKYLEAVILQN